MRFQEARGFESFTDAFGEASELRKAEPQGFSKYGNPVKIALVKHSQTIKEVANRIA
jgi:hypothetical protein